MDDSSILDSPSDSVHFVPSQLGDGSSTPVAYTGDPWSLFLYDCRLLTRVWKTIPGILLPIRFGKNASPWDELYPKKWNLIALTMHVVFLPIQFLFLASIPVVFLLQIPALWVVFYVFGFVFLNKMAFLIINGTKLVLGPSKNIIVPPKDEEYWIYMNGVSVGRDWLQANIDRLSLTFGRKVIGIHNPTSGIIFDIIQCIVQRNLSYVTDDIRAAYVKIKAALLKPHVHKVVFILHSQGGIEGGLIIDWLLDELPHATCRKLEVYTFGNAANHFNNPISDTDTSEQAVLANKPTRKKSYVSPISQHKHAIGHIEHYANRGDFVAEFGVLAYSTISNRFMGRLFVSPDSGHLLNQHYLHSMFPLNSDGVSCCDESPFMEMDVDIGNQDELQQVRESLASSLTLGYPTKGMLALVADSNDPVAPIKRSWSLVGDADHAPRKLKVKDLSRLWQYRNGGTPPDDDFNSD